MFKSAVQYNVHVNTYLYLYCISISVMWHQSHEQSHPYIVAELATAARPLFGGHRVLEMIIVVDEREIVLQVFKQKQYNNNYCFCVM